MDDFPIVSVTPLLEASKNKSYRDNVRKMARVLGLFLQRNGLTKTTIIADGTTPADDFEILRSHLTDEGYALIQASLHKWMRGLESGKKPVDDTQVLERALEVIRQKR